MNKMTKLAQAISATAGIVLSVSAYQALAQEDEGKRSNAMEEVIVTAQRSEESIQDVPIAVTALSGEMLEDRQVINPSDLQLNVPNVSFTATNFGGSSFSIRGIGQLVIASSGEAGVSTHINQIPIAGNLNAIEYFDVERVEILRGPQGTLFGRNATGGAVNMVTKMPSFDAFDGFVDFEYGNYEHIRAKAAINVPLSGNLALRVAGMALNRGGYINNRAFGQENANIAGQTLPGIDKDVDGRDLWAGRATLLWQPSDSVKVWVQYNQFKEDDDRARITNIVCKRTTQPVPGCEADVFGAETPHIGSTTAGIVAAAVGLLPAGGGDGIGTEDYARPTNLGLREVHTDFEPIFQQDEKSFLFGADLEVGAYSISLLAAYQDLKGYSRQDYNQDVGPNLILVGNIPGHPAAALGVSFPTSNPPIGPNGDRNANNPCAFEGPNREANAGRAPLRRGAAPDPSCLHPYGGTTRIFAFDQVDIESTYWTAEAKIASHYDGKLNFTAGVNTYDTETASDYYVVANTLDVLTLAAGFYPGYFDSATAELNQTGIAGYGELYFDITPALKLTVGLRYNIDKKDILDSTVLYNSITTGGVTTRRAPLPASINSSTALVDDAGVPVIIAIPAADAADRNAGNLVRFYANNAGMPELLTALETANTNVQTLLENATLAPLVTTATAARDALATNTDAAMNMALTSARDVAKAALDAQFLATSTDTTIVANVATLNAIETARAAIRGIVPIVPAPGENRIGTGSPSDFEWKEFSGRVGFDWALSNDTLVYGFLNRGYKPGGFNPALSEAFRSTSSFKEEFAAEEVNALEVGTKNTLLGGSLVLNAAAFFYDYKGLQVTRIANNSSLNENIDSEIMGLELELIWQPPALSNLTIDATYSYLNSEIGDSRSIDPINKTGSNTDFVTLKNLDPGSLSGVNYVASRAIFTDALIDQVLCSPGTAPGATNPCIAANVASGFYPANEGSTKGIPALASRSALIATAVGFENGRRVASGMAAMTPAERLEFIGANVRDGNTVSLKGNSLPNSPEHTIHVGASYAFPLGSAGSLALRGDYYWQSESYARDFNTKGDEIEGWDQINASLTYATIDERLQVRLWVRNITNSENVTGKYLTSDTSGLFRNYFLTEPRIYGASVRFKFN